MEKKICLFSLSIKFDWNQINIQYYRDTIRWTQVMYSKFIHSLANILYVF